MISESLFLRPGKTLLFVQLPVALLLLAAESLSGISAYVPASNVRRASSSGMIHRSPAPIRSGYSPSFVSLGSKSDGEDDEEIFTPTNHQSPATDDDESSYNYMDDLTPPPVNFARNSILFSENPSTKARNNPSLSAWKAARTYLPAVVTGAWPWRDVPALDERPVACLYNLVIVRLPVLAVATSYLYQKIAQNHDLVIDMGFGNGGPQAVPPVLVLGVLVLILL